MTNDRSNCAYYSTSMCLRICYLSGVLEMSRQHALAGLSKSIAVLSQPTPVACPALGFLSCARKRTTKNPNWRTTSVEWRSSRDGIARVERSLCTARPAMAGDSECFGTGLPGVRLWETSLVGRPIGLEVTGVTVEAPFQHRIPPGLFVQFACSELVDINTGWYPCHLCRLFCQELCHCHGLAACE